MNNDYFDSTILSILYQQKIKAIERRPEQTHMQMVQERWLQQEGSEWATSALRLRVVAVIIFLREPVKKCLPLLRTPCWLAGSTSGGSVWDRSSSHSVQNCLQQGMLVGGFWCRPMPQGQAITNAQGRKASHMRKLACTFHSWSFAQWPWTQAAQQYPAPNTAEAKPTW